jgi:hypothetical protein
MNKFDELTKTMAQSVTRRAAFKKFGVGLAGMAMACFANRTRAYNCLPGGYRCQRNNDCCSGNCAWASGSKLSPKVKVCSF